MDDLAHVAALVRVGEVCLDVLKVRSEYTAPWHVSSPPLMSKALLILLIRRLLTRFEEAVWVLGIRNWTAMKLQRPSTDDIGSGKHPGLVWVVRTASWFERVELPHFAFIVPSEWWHEATCIINSHP
jgi:hypothetical protein